MIHLDLGIGGAERLIIDACVGLQKHQHTRPCSITLVTTHHDPKRAFSETVNGEVKTVVFGGWIPRTVGGGGAVLCSTLRMGYAAIMACAVYPTTDVFIVDQLSPALLVLRLFAPRIPRLFYCHFPDQCCDGNRNAVTRSFNDPRTRWWKRVYRTAFDSLERYGMQAATTVVCNSQFSRGITLDTFPELTSVIQPSDVLYPPVPAAPVTQRTLSDCSTCKSLAAQLEGRTVFVSVNRYERGKNLELAIQAFDRFVSLGAANTGATRPLLVMAGGYDPRLQDAVEYAEWLKGLAAAGGERREVLFLHNISTAEKDLLFHRMTALLYTPLREHFGIVPLEAMRAGKPVIAVNYGGPCESVGDAGVLCDGTPESFAEAMASLSADEELRARLGTAGKRRVTTLFSIEVFSESLARRVVSIHEAAVKKV